MLSPLETLLQKVEAEFSSIPELGPQATTAAIRDQNPALLVGSDSLQMLRWEETRDSQPHINDWTSLELGSLERVSSVLDQVGEKMNGFLI
jgi:hypothetical protein